MFLVLGDCMYDGYESPNGSFGHGYGAGHGPGDGDGNGYGNANNSGDNSGEGFSSEYGQGCDSDGCSKDY